MNPLVLYHGDQDGFCSAFIAWIAFNGRGQYRAVQYGVEAPIYDTIDRDVYVLDFSFPRHDLINMRQGSRSLLVLDHHKTAAEHLAGLPYCVFDMEKSGAGLTWDHFREQVRVALYFSQAAESAIDGLVKYVQDADLWTWKLEGSRQVNAAIRSYPFDFKIWLDQFTAADWDIHALVDGRAILRAQEMQTQIICNSAREVSLAGNRVYAANTPVFQSEVAGKLAERGDFGVAWFQRADGKFKYSLRSTKESGYDVSAVAQIFGGGGHHNAAGFESSRMAWDE